jgi:hypothetical protein
VPLCAKSASPGALGAGAQLHVLLGLGDDHPGQERADDRREADLLGDGRETEAEQNRGKQSGLG